MRQVADLKLSDQNQLAEVACIGNVPRPSDNCYSVVTMCEGGNHHHNNGRGYRPGAFFSNWRTYDGPFHVKLTLALRNNWKKLRTLSECCGNDGQPGC